MHYKVHVRIVPRAGLLDPQGQAVEHALSALGFAEASGVRVGKAIELSIDANPVTEDYLVEVEA
jgi:phosphoribosylformylglycinamidine synthase